MNAASRAAIRRRKQEMAAKSPSRSLIETEEIREATRLKFCELLSTKAAPPGSSDNVRAKELAKQIEEVLYGQHKEHTTAYKSSFRKLYASLRRQTTSFRSDLLAGRLDPHEFVGKSVEELKPAQQKADEEILRKESIRQSIGQQLLPENVNYVKDGRDREKWGVSRSAAAIDD